MPTYIIRAGDSGPVKIGWAEDVAVRVSKIQTAHHETLNVIREIDTWWHSEPQFHERFAAYRLRGEWFFFCDEMLTFVPPVPEAEKPTERGLAERQMLAEAQEHIKRLLGEPAWHENRPTMFARVAAASGLPLSRVRGLFYGKGISVWAHEIDVLRKAVAIPAPKNPAGWVEPWTRPEALFDPTPEQRARNGEGK